MDASWDGKSIKSLSKKASKNRCQKEDDWEASWRHLGSSWGLKGSFKLQLQRSTRRRRWGLQIPGPPGPAHFAKKTQLKQDQKVSYRCSDTPWARGLANYRLFLEDVLWTFPCIRNTTTLGDARWPMGMQKTKWVLEC